jgi:hypothetical protein
MEITITLLVSKDNLNGNQTSPKVISQEHSKQWVAIKILGLLQRTLGSSFWHQIVKAM